MDLSGRPFLVYKAEFKVARIGDLQSELIEEFMKAFVQEGKFNLHVENLYGRNQHHIAETIFKATARALHLATQSRTCRYPFDEGSSVAAERRNDFSHGRKPVDASKEGHSPEGAAES